MLKIDLNLDGGECETPIECAREQALLPLVSTINIACGGHAGNPAVMDATLRAARDCGLNIGAHPSYPDRAHFGRKSLSMTATALRESWIAQIETLANLAARLNLPLSHVKPHGALYNDAAVNAELADVLIEATRDLAPDLPILLLAGSVFERRAHDAGRRVIAEGFTDRRYQAIARLRSRDHPDALIDDPQESLQQALSIIQCRAVQTVNGDWVDCRADSLCVHGDHPNALPRLQALRAGLSRAGIKVLAFQCNRTTDRGTRQ